MKRISNNGSLKQIFFDQAINLFWTALSFYPVILLWFRLGMNNWFYLMLGASLIVVFLPRKILDRFQLSDKARQYEKWGVRIIRKMVQGGDWARAAGVTQHKKMVNNASQARQYLNTIAMYERFHWFCLVFFLLSSIYGFLLGNTSLAIWVMTANLLYNGCPILLQQYNRLRIQKMLRYS